jgi:hypothetical protein
VGFLDAGRQTYGSATNRLPCCRNGRRLNAKKRGQRVHADQADELASSAASDDGGRQMDLVRCRVLYVVSRYNIQRRISKNLHVNLIG